MHLKRVYFLTGARSEYDIMVPVIRALGTVPGMCAGVIPCAAHLSPFHGMSIDHIQCDGFTTIGPIESLLASQSLAGRALSFAHLSEGLTRLLDRDRPDLLFITGDREEALAGALVGNFLKIPVAHLHGGDRCASAEIDEVLRPAISKLSHLHFTATESHRARLIGMGESPSRIWVSGAPGLDRLLDEPDVDIHELMREVRIDVQQPFFLLIHHPTRMADGDTNGEEMADVLAGVLSLGHPVLCSYPNNDPGNVEIRQAIDEATLRSPHLHVHHHLARKYFVSLYRRCSAIVGNSSSIVIESSFLKRPAILIGARQNQREIAANVIRVPGDSTLIRAACIRALEDASFKSVVAACGSLYGDGRSGARIAGIISGIKLTGDLMAKQMTY